MTRQKRGLITLISGYIIGGFSDPIGHNTLGVRIQCFQLLGLMAVSLTEGKSGEKSRDILLWTTCFLLFLPVVLENIVDRS